MISATLLPKKRRIKTAPYKIKIVKMLRDENGNSNHQKDATSHGFSSDVNTMHWYLMHGLFHLMI